MKQRLLPSLLSLGLCALAGAQTPAPFAGSWKVTWQGEKRPEEARLVIAEDGKGTWKTAHSSKSNKCLAVEIPFLLQETTKTEATARLKASEVLTGCSDSTLKLKLLDEKSMSGTRGQSPLTIVRD